MARLNPHGLTDQQDRFCMEYVANGGNATQAYISAGYSESTAEQASSRLLTNVKVQERVKELQTSVAERLGITQEYLLGHLKEIIDNHTNPNKDRLRAVELAGKNLAMWVEKTENKNKNEGDVTAKVILIPAGSRESGQD
jgi:phage terminase small subunit